MLFSLLSGRVRNGLAFVISMILCGLLFFTYTNVIWSAWLYAHWGVMSAVIVVVMNVITKLTPWKGDDSFFAWVWKLIEEKRGNQRA